MSWRAADGVVTETINGETILLDSAGNRYLTLNETASAIFEAASSGVPANAIIERLVTDWAIDPLAARRAVEQFTDKLVGAGLLRTE